MSNFDRAFDDLIGNEGGYSNNAQDPGGETNWGVTKAVARASGYQGDMRTMTKAEAKGIYADLYWNPAFDSLAYPLAFSVFDGAVNSGVEQSVKWLQRAVGVDDDGKLGPLTQMAAISADPMRAVIAYNAERLAFMTDLRTWQTFGRGWAKRIANNLRKAAKNGA